jgi:hypothetical protein
VLLRVHDLGATAVMPLERQSGRREPAPPPNSPAEQQLVQRLTTAFDSADVDGIVALLTEDAWLTMPPMPLE